MREWLRVTPAMELAPGDEFVKPNYLQVYGTDRDGWASLIPSAGTRFEVLRTLDVNAARSLTALRVSDGVEITQAIPSDSTTVLKVVTRRVMNDV